MYIISIKNNDKYLNEYLELCYLEWSNNKNKIDDYLKEKKINIKEKVIEVLGLINNQELIGFVSLLKYDSSERKDLTPWYATMYIKKEYRKKGYSVLLNNAIKKKAQELGYNKIYLKTNLINYYEKFGATYLDKLQNGEKLYYMELKKE